MTKPSYVSVHGTRSASARSVMKILANANRYEIVRLMLHATNDYCVHELSAAMDVSQSATSHQLAHLEAFGIVRSTRMGKSKCYVLTDAHLTKKLTQVVRALA